MNHKHIHRIFHRNIEILEGKYVSISDKLACHRIYTVLRGKFGDEISIFNEFGIEYLCIIESIKKNSILLIVKERKNLAYTGVEKENVKVILVQSLVQCDKLKTIIQKSTELGIREIIPVETKKSIKYSISDSKKKQLENVAINSVEQCGRYIVPIIHDQIDIENIYEYILNRYEIKNPYIVVMDNICGKQIEISEIIKKCRDTKYLFVLIGPEAGFDDCEIEYVKKQNENTEFIKIGDRILRTETASSVFLSLLVYRDII